MNNFIFVFGSNLAGIHGAGAARFALKHYGAIMGKGVGHVNNSYAIPTKDVHLVPLPLDEILTHVNVFKQYAHDNLDKEFILTRIGCGLAGYSNADIAPMFRGHSSNCYFDSAWAPYLPHAKYWGTF